VLVAKKNIFSNTIVSVAKEIDEYNTKLKSPLLPQTAATPSPPSSIGILEHLHQMISASGDAGVV